LIMDADAGFEVIKRLTKSRPEKYDYDYKSIDESATGKTEYLYYVEPMTSDITLTGVPDEDYAVWKLYATAREGMK